MADAIRIGAPDGSVVEFPSGTSDDVIKRVMAQNYPASTSPPAETTAPSPLVDKSAAPAPAEKSTLAPIREAIHAPTRALENAFFFGLGDRIRAGMGAVTGEGYSATLKKEQADTRNYAEEHPYANLAVDALGGVVGPAGAIGVAGKAGSLLGKMAYGGITNAAVGGLQGFNSSEDWTNLPQAARDAGRGAAFGMIGGMAIPAVSRVASPAVEAVANAFRGRADGMSRIASNKLVSKMRSDTPQAVQAELDRLGPEAMLADAGPGMKSLTQGARSYSDEAKAIIDPALTDRNVATNARMKADVDNALGTFKDKDAIAATNEIVGARSRIDESNYGLAFEQAPKVKTAPVLTELHDAIISAPDGSAERKALENLNRMMTKDSTRAKIGPDGRPTTEFETVRVSQDRASVLHKVKQELDAVIEHGEPGLGIQPGALRNREGSLKRFRYLLNQALEEQVPNYAHANATSAQFARRADALKEGTKFLRSTDTTPSPGRLEDQWWQMEPGEQIAFAKGSRAEIDRLMGNKANDVLALRDAIKGEGSWNAEKLAIVHGDEPAGQLIASVDRNAKFRDTFADLLRNSQTEPRQASVRSYKEGFEPLEAPSGGRSLFATIYDPVRSKVVQPLWSALTKNENLAKAHGEIAKVLTAQGADRDRYVQDIVRALNARAPNVELGRQAGNVSAVSIASVMNALRLQQQEHARQRR